MVDRVQANDPRGIEDLYTYFSKGARFYFCRHLGLEELDDRVHDSFLLVLDRITRDETGEAVEMCGTEGKLNITRSQPCA